MFSPSARVNENRYNKIVTENDCVMVDILVDVSNKDGQTKHCSKNKIISKQQTDSFNSEKDLGAVVGKQSSAKLGRRFALARAGPRATLHFRPSEVTAAIVTCGGLCPGLNTVIHHLVNTLWHNYDVKRIIGVRGGYHGLSRFGDDFDFASKMFESGYASDGDGGETPAATPMSVSQRPERFHRPSEKAVKPEDAWFVPVRLTPASVKSAHHEGGTILGSTRGGYDLQRIRAFLDKNGINVLFILGGDGTHRGGFALAKECIAQRENKAIVCIPKTIDNDIAVVDRSFGFLTAVEEAAKAIRAAVVEARSNMPNGIGIIKLMGRSAGYISAFATMAAGGDVDLCLIPEVPVVLDGEHGLLPHVARTLDRKGHCVIVVAEGAGQDLFNDELGKDASGNAKLQEIGIYLRDVIKAYFGKGKRYLRPQDSDDTGEVAKREVTIKYIDPSYMIRSVPANSFDSYDCTVLANGAVHGAMAGLTGFTVGMVNSHSCLIPIPLVERNSPRTLNNKGRTWERVLAITKQPNTVGIDEGNASGGGSTS